jgi:hypothetical protein
VPVRRDGGDARGDLDVAVGQAPVDAVIVEVDAAQRQRLGRGLGEREVQLAPLAVDRGVFGEPADAARVVVVQVTDGHDRHVARVDPDVLEGPLDAVTVVADQLVLDAHVDHAPPQLLVEQDRGVEPRVEQHPPAVDLQQNARHGLAEADRRVGRRGSRCSAGCAPTRT